MVVEPEKKCPEEHERGVKAPKRRGKKNDPTTIRGLPAKYKGEYCVRVNSKKKEQDQ